MTDEESKDPKSEPDKAKPPAWEDSHTAASLPSWWRPEDEAPAKPSEMQPPAAPHTAPPPAPAAPAAPMPPPAPAAPTAPPSPGDWEVSTTAKELPTWWRPEQPPETAASHAAPTVPPAPAPAPPMRPASPMPPAPPPMQSAPPMPAPPTMAPAAPPTNVPSAPPTPHPMPPPADRYEKTMVLGVMPAAAMPTAILVVKSGPDMGFKFRVKPTLVATLGRDLENEVVLDDPACSRRHAQIEFKDGSYVLTDLGSANGTLVNDQRVSTRQLSDGDRIVVGQDQIVISIM